MTNKQRDALLRSAMADLNKAEGALRQTLEGYVTHPDGPNWQTAFKHWKNAQRKLNQLQQDLGRAPVPALGPVLEGDRSMLEYAPTHNTDGVPNHPAFDTGFGEAGRWVICPEALVIQRQSGAMGGDAVFAIGSSGIGYWIGHIGIAPATGTRFRKGERLARIANQEGTDHVHWGLDVRPLTGQSLKYGRNGNGPDYTFGSPSIGTQLRRMLEA